jgi:Zn-finger nucleic acid-binding protein
MIVAHVPLARRPAVGSEHKKIKVNSVAFLNDFELGTPEEELKTTYGLDHSQLVRVVGLLRQEGKLTAETIARRNENIRIRFGEQKGDASPAETKVAVDLDTGLVLHCPSCGAPVKRGSEQCEYCRAHLDFSLKGKTTHCPHCYQRIPADSRFCAVCARPIQPPQEQGAALASHRCPRCDLLMHEKKIGDFSVITCDTCGGLFIPHKTFEMMQDASTRVVEALGGPTLSRGAYETKVQYLRCPVCRNMMNRKNFVRVSGVIVDVCRPHGIWFDAGEMEKIMDFIARGGMREAREAEREIEKDQEAQQKLRRERMMYDSGGSSLFSDGAGSRGVSVDLGDMISGIVNLFRK